MARWRIPHLQFSLSSLLLVVIFTSACFGLWWRWDPWVCDLVLRDPRGIISQATILSHSGRIATFDESNTGICIWSADTGQIVNILKEPLGMSPDGRWFMKMSADGTMGVHDVETGALRVALCRTEENLLRACFSADGKWAITVGESNAVRVWNLRTGKEHVVFQQHEGAAFHFEVAISPNGQLAATADKRTIRVWNIVTGKQHFVLPRPDCRKKKARKAPSTYSGFDAVFSSDARRLAMTHGDANTTRVWDAETGKELLVLGHSLPISKLAFSPDGRYIVSAGYDAILGGLGMRFWDAQTGAEFALFPGRANEPSLAFSPDGRRFVSCGPPSNGSTSTKVFLWDLETGRRIATLDQPDDFWDAEFSPNNQQIITSGMIDKTARVWSLRRPDSWWGIAWLPESWIALFSGGGLLAILVRNYYRRRRKPVLGLFLSRNHS